MKLVYIPYLREGIVPTASAARARASVGLQLESPGHAARDVTRVMPLLGPGDVVAIEPRQVLRVTPAPGTRDAEPEFFPSIEFDTPDLPWAYSPVAHQGQRVLPWIALVVLEAGADVTLVPGQQGQSPWILRLKPEVARHELPDLTDAWGWAHAQVACAGAADVAATLANHPDRTLSRLLAARRLLPFRSYLACVVPSFLSGLVAGLGGNPAEHQGITTGLEPSWSASSPPMEIPVYYSWTFSTGEAGDFESLAQRLHAAPLDASVAPTRLRLSLPSGDGTESVDWEPPLRVSGSTTTTPRSPVAAVGQIRDALRAGGSTRRVLGPSYFGAPWVDGRPLTPLTPWNVELNLTPMSRAAASLGAEAVRGEQEDLVSAASDQLDAFRARQREGRRRQLAVAFSNRVKLRLASAPVAETTRVFAPIVAAAQRDASNVGLYTTAGRQIVRKEWSVVSRLGGLAFRPDVVVSAELAPVLVEPIVYVPEVVREPAREITPPIEPADTTAIPTGTFSPRFARPMSEPLAERHPELMLPGAGSIDANGVLVVESDPRFVEAFLVGANQELNYELLWRGLPADARATAFRRFWAHAGTAEDIDDITTWDPATSIGSHIKTSAAMILLVRSELVRRYPSVVVAAVPAVWNTINNTRSPMKEAPFVMPSFRGRIGADVLYAGFSHPSLADAIGAAAPPGPAGWFFLLSENPGDPRFGLDPGGESTMPTRATLGWGHLNPKPAGVYAPVASFPTLSNPNFTPATATAASMANIVRQRPFRAFLHASLLVRLPA